MAEGPAPILFVPSDQSACGQPDADAVMYQHLHSVGPAVGKQVGLMRMGRAKDFDDVGQGGVGSGAHVHGIGGQPHGINSDHVRIT